MSYPFSDQSPNAELPPLRIHHFMLWTAVCALMLTTLSPGGDANMQVSDSSFASISTKRSISDIPHILVNSACLSGLLLGWYWKRQGHMFFDEPGQMAFVLHGLLAAWELVFAAAVNSSSINNEGDPFPSTADVATLGWIVVGIIQLVLYFRYSRRFQKFGKWGRFFRVVGLVTLLQYVFFFVLPFMFVIGGVPSASSMQMVLAFYAIVPFGLGLVELSYWFLAVRTDRREGYSYHWTHWLGAATWPAILLASFISYVYMILFVFPDV